VKITPTTLAVLALALFVGTLWLLWPAVEGGFLSGMDDDGYPGQAVLLRGLMCAPSNGRSPARYHTVIHLHGLRAYLVYEVWKTNTADHRAMSMRLHASKALRVFCFVWTLPRAVATMTASERMWVAFGVGNVFAIHPLQVESVGRISGRTKLLCMWVAGPLAAICLRMRRNERADREAETGLRLDPTLTGTDYVLACLNSEHGDFASALKHLRVLVPCRPQLAPVITQEQALASLRLAPEHATKVYAVIEAAK
jgi:hypothetical protein